MMPKILVVDDDPLVSRMLTDHIGPLGFQIIGASNGANATACASYNLPALILVDGLLPDTNGLDWIRSYRQQGGQAPIMFASSFFRDLHSFRQLTQELDVGPGAS